MVLAAIVPALGYLLAFHLRWSQLYEWRTAGRETKFPTR